MPAFGRTSRERLEGVHPDLVAVFEDVVEIFDITIMKDGGVRTDERQAEIFADGDSKTIDSKHMIQDDGYGHAIDAGPYPIDFNDLGRYYYLAGLVKMAAKKRGVTIRWGRDWDSDNDFNDQTFNDYGHWEIVIYD